MNVRCDLACHVRVGTLVKVVSNVNKCKYRPYYASLKIVMYAVTQRYDMVFAQIASRLTITQTQHMGYTCQ